MEDWDLQAVVRKYTNNIEAFVNNPSTCLAPLSTTTTIRYENFDFDAFYDSPKATTILDDFGDLHKFFPQTILTPSSMYPQERNQQAEKFQQLQQGSLATVGSPVASSTAAVSPPPRPKKRRSNEKRVVEELTAEKLALDVWAWRKYGQKPIKGSPYPRSYYRCSSSKGCPARRQVEQSSSSPHMFIVTYSAEHNHAKPTKRSSLAGTTRRKSNLSIHQEEDEEEIINIQSNNISSWAVEDEEVINNSEYCESLDHNSVIPNVNFRDSLFPTLEEMAGISTEWTFEFDGCS